MICDTMIHDMMHNTWSMGYMTHDAWPMTSWECQCAHMLCSVMFCSVLLCCCCYLLHHPSVWLLLLQSHVIRWFHVKILTRKTQVEAQGGVNGHLHIYIYITYMFECYVTSSHVMVCVCALYGVLYGYVALLRCVDLIWWFCCLYLLVYRFAMVS